MALIINLNRARKAKAQAEKSAAASTNRIRFGRTKAEKAIEAAEGEQTRRALDGARLDDTERDDSRDSPAR